MSRVNSSVLWDIFKKSETEKKAKCTLCGSWYNFKASTGNLKSHLKSKQRQHTVEPNVDTEVATCSRSAAAATSLIVPSTSSEAQVAQGETVTTGQGSLSLATSSFGRFQQTIDRYSTTKKISKEQKQKIDNDLLGLFYHGYQPFSLVEEKAFRKFVSWIPGYTLPTRKTISNVLIPALYDKTKESVKEELSVSGVEHVCLTGDLWTSKANESYLAVRAHYVFDDFTIKSILIECKGFPVNHTSENIRIALVNMEAEWGLRNKINFVVTDNAPNVTKAIRDIGWKHYGCYAHTLNLIVQDVLKKLEPPNNPVLDKIKKIVRHFKSSSTAQQKLLKSQTSEEPSCIPKRLKQEVPTRWNSTYYMLQRFVDLESHIRATVATLRQDLPLISNEEWTFAAELSKILKPFDDATTSLSGQNYMTASSVIMMTRCLISGYDILLQENFSDCAMDVILQLRSGLINKFSNVERSGTFSVCTFLDPRYKIAVFSDANEARNSRKRIQDMLIELIAKETQSNCSTQNIQQQVQNYDKFSPWSILQGIVSQQQNTGTPLSKAIKEIDTYLNEEILPVFARDGSWNCPMVWWRNHRFTYPYLSKLIKKYGNIMATSVPCERVFSKTGLIISDRRTRLTSSKVEQLTFLNINLKEL